MKNMPISLNPNISLLQHISSREIEDLIIEHKLTSEKGFKFHYFIDNFDIGKYSFPFGLFPSLEFDKRNEQPVEVITDEQIAYYHLINNEKKLLLFDEHKDEINQFIRKIKILELYGHQTINALNEFISYFDKKKNEVMNFEEFKDVMELFSTNNVSLLISIALGALYDGKKKLSDLINNKLLTDIEDLNKEIHNTKIIERCKTTELSEKFFDRLISQLKYGRKRNDSINRVSARYNKCKVYERLLCINNHTKKNKHLYFILSSSKTSIKRIPEIAQSMGYSIMIDDNNFIPVRSVSQIYVKLLLSDNANYKNILNSLKELVKFKEDSNDRHVNDEVNSFIADFFSQKVSSLRENFENASLLLNINDFNLDFQKAIDNKLIIKNKDLLESIKYLLNLASDEEKWKKQQDISLSEMLFINKYIKTFRDALESAKIGNKKLSGFSGRDYIDSPFHSIPFVFINKSNSNFNETIDDLIHLITESHKKNITTDKFIESITETFLSFNKTVSETTNEEHIIMLLTLLMLAKDEAFKPNEIAYNWVTELINNELYNEDWYLDFLYIKSATARRIEKYDVAINIAKKGIEIDANDPRFYQSLCLNYYCKFRESKNKELSFLNNAIENCKKSCEKYKSIDKESRILSIHKAIASNHNSLAYMLALQYQITEEEKYLVNSRDYLKILKDNCSEYYYSAEFQHTEAFVEFMESKMYDDNQKLCFAKERIEKAISLNGKSMYFDLKNKIIQTINEKDISC